jgi:N-acetylated-alpha-linked acidic dipeptidase
LSFISRTYGVYHSVYENEDYYKRFVDPDFDACDTMSKMLGLLILRLSSNHLLNFHLEEQSQTLNQYLLELENDNLLIKYKTSLSNVELNQFNLYLNILNETIKELDNQIFTFNSELKQFTSQGVNQKNYEIQLRSFNEKLSKFERNSIREEGIHGREWFKNVLCSTGTEYGDDGFEVFPGLMEAMRANDFGLVLKSLEQIITSIRSSINFLS